MVMLATVIAAALLVPLVVYLPVMPAKIVALVFLYFALAAISVLFPTIIQLATPSDIRSQVSAIILFVVNLVGIGFGPTAIALVTDYGFRNLMALGHSIAVVGISTLVVGAGFLWRTLHPFEHQVVLVNRPQ